jgi:hypothetical protein
MTAKILLCEDTSMAAPDVHGKTLCVCHKAYQPPVGNWPCVSFDRFRDEARELIRGLDSLIFVGMTRAITSGNRTEMVFEILHNKTAELHKISVDTYLFRAEPWRAWFHFGYAGVPYRDYAYSFIAESHYNTYIDGVRTENPFSLEEITRWGDGVICSDHGRYFEEPIIQVVETSPDDQKRYAEFKATCFREETSPRPIIRRLSEFAQQVFPDRSIPGYAQLFGSRSHRIVATDLAVDRWLVAGIRETMHITNGVAREFHHGRGNGRV